MTTTQFVNVTEARAHITNLATQAANDDSFVILLKNGKPIGSLINSRDTEAFRKWKEDQALKKKFEEWAEKLPTMEISEEQARSIAEAREELAEKQDRYDDRPASEFLGIK